MNYTAAIENNNSLLLAACYEQLINASGAEKALENINLSLVFLEKVVFLTEDLFDECIEHMLSKKNKDFYGNRVDEYSNITIESVQEISMYYKKRNSNLKLEISKI